MDKASRNVLYVNPTQAEGLPLERLEAAGWRIEVAHTLSEAEKITRQKRFHVGLTRFDRTHRVDTEALLNVNGIMEWVALMSPDVFEDDKIREVISHSYYDYHTMPVDLERLLITLGHAYGMAILRDGARTKTSVTSMGDIVGASHVMRRLFADIMNVANVDAPVLLNGETGTGKELIARAIHDSSRRSGRPFIAVKCGALPDTLIRSELFGHEDIATMDHGRIGYFETAAGGTILLNDIEYLSLTLQARLLRVLEENTIQHVGGIAEIPVDVRLIASTSADLDRAVKEKRFRADLYYRLKKSAISVPPLSQRIGDAKLLANCFFQRFASEKNRNVRGISKAALDAISEYHWPGNVRELMNRVRQAMTSCDECLIMPQHLGLTDSPSLRDRETLDQARAQADKDVIIATLHYTKNNISRAARQLGISRVTLYRLIKKYEIVV